MQSEPTDQPLVILDTSTVRNVIQGAPGGIDTVETLLPIKGKVEFKISEVALSEICLALLEDRIPWNEWRKRIHLVDSLLTQSLPVISWGSILNDQEFDFESVANSAWWRALCSANSQEAIEAGATVTDKSGRVYEVTTRLEHAREVHLNCVSRWAYDLDRAKALLSRATSEGRGLRESDVLSLVEHNPGLPRHLVERFDAWNRVWARYVHMYMEGKYNPASERRRGDALDFYSLKFLSIPAFVCTDDERLIEIVRLTRSTQADGVLHPRDLLERFSKNKDDRNDEHKR